MGPLDLKKDKLRGRIAFLPDPKLSRERLHVLSSALLTLKGDYEIDLLSPTVTEVDLIAKTKDRPYSLVLLPWHQFADWNALDAFFGQNRFEGPMIAGYLGEPVSINDLPELQASRANLIELFSLNPEDAGRLIGTLADEHRRTGVASALIDPNTPIYTDAWTASQGWGGFLEKYLNLGELNQAPWEARQTAVRRIIMGLWSLVFQFGPGRSTGVNPDSVKGHFQLGMDSHTLILRMCMQSTKWRLPDYVQMFWPKNADPLSPLSDLIQASDFFRVRPIAGSSWLEVTSFLFSQSPLLKAPHGPRGISIEPTHIKLAAELDFTTNSPRVAPFPGMGPTQSVKLSGQDLEKRTKRLLTDAAAKIHELKSRLAERDEEIQELRAGGVGTAAPIPIPEMEDLLSTYQERYMDSKILLREMEAELHRFAQDPSKKSELEQLKLKMQAVENRLRAWLTGLAGVLQKIRATEASTTEAK